MTGETRPFAWALGIAFVTAVLCAVAFTGGAAALQTGDAFPAENESSFVVDVQSDGTAAVAITYTFDLADGDEEAAFDDLRTDEEALETFRGRFETRLSDVAADASTADREMSVSDVTVETERLDDTGVVRISLRWAGLAATGDGRSTVTEPFASGFEPDRPLYVSFPDGYETASSVPDPDRRGDRYLAWSAGTDLSGFEVVAETTDDGTDTDEAVDSTDTDETDDSTDTDEDGGATGDDTAGTDGGAADDTGAGFGVFVAIVAVVAGTLAALRRS